MIEQLNGYTFVDLNMHVLTNLKISFLFIFFFKL